ncbi:3-carboxy-cis,cis-mucoante lactonizing enzyme, partial [Teratosphaeria nubilosa]
MKHHLFIGTWTPPGAIFTITFDDHTHKLELLQRTPIPQDEPISWLTLSHNRTQIYGASMKKWSSHAITTPSEITHSASLPMGGDPSANDATTKTRAIFILAAHKPPYCVYGNPFYDHAGYINVHSVNEDGSLAQNIQNAPLDPTSAVHGMAFDAEEEYLYSADMWANKIWTHKKDPKTGHLTLISSLPAPDPHDHPRWLALHPSGTHLYVLMETTNRLCIYTLSRTTHTPTYTQQTYPLIPPDFNTFHPKMYRSDVVTVSASGKYLFATARSNSPHLTGYMSVFGLGEKGEVERQLCLNPTVTSGGHSNAVAPCPWSDEWVALTDDEKGFVEVYRWKDEWLGRVAHLDVQEPGFGMNAAWY